jgi:hypothetical protein
MAFESAPERIAFIKNGTIIENNTSISSNLKINLKSHQMNMVNAMMNLENNREIERLQPCRREDRVRIIAKPDKP